MPLKTISNNIKYYIKSETISQEDSYLIFHKVFVIYFIFSLSFLNIIIKIVINRYIMSILILIVFDSKNIYYSISFYIFYILFSFLIKSNFNCNV